jgi:S1-C subfamily serine protease
VRVFGSASGSVSRHFLEALEVQSVSISDGALRGLSMIRFMISWLLLATVANGQTFVEQNHAIRKSVCEVKCGGDYDGWGTGVWIDETHVLTALHVVSGGQRWRVIYRDKELLAEIEACEPKYDWAILKVESVEAVVPVEVRDPDLLLRLDEPLHGYGFGPHADDRRRLAVIRGKYNVWRIVGNEKPRSGDSGGPILDGQGRLVGIINGRRDDTGIWYGHGLHCGLKGFINNGGFRRWGK